MKKIFLVVCLFNFLSCRPSQKLQNNPENVPDCVKKLIRDFSAAEKTNPPRAVYRYQYQGNVVYFVPAPCCDFFSDLYDDNCNLLGHPDGGITGRGDGRVADFFEKRMNEQIIWMDTRK